MKTTHKKIGKILCFFELCDWGKDNRCTRCGRERNWREKYDWMHILVGY